MTDRDVVHGRQDANAQGDGPDSGSPGDRPAGGRTSALAGPSCRVCGGPIRGNRRNGFCSDRCRLRASRAAQRERVAEQFKILEAVVAALRAEMQSVVERETVSEE